MIRFLPFCLIIGFVFTATANDDSNFAYADEDNHSSYSDEWEDDDFADRNLCKNDESRNLNDQMPLPDHEHDDGQIQEKNEEYTDGLTRFLFAKKFKTYELRERLRFIVCNPDIFQKLNEILEFLDICENNMWYWRNYESEALDNYLSFCRGLSRQFKKDAFKENVAGSRGAFEESFINFSAVCDFLINILVRLEQDIINNIDLNFAYDQKDASNAEPETKSSSESQTTSKIKLKSNEEMGHTGSQELITEADWGYLRSLNSSKKGFRIQLVEPTERFFRRAENGFAAIKKYSSRNKSSPKNEDSPSTEPESVSKENMFSRMKNTLTKRQKANKVSSIDAFKNEKLELTHPRDFHGQPEIEHHEDHHQQSRFTHYENYQQQFEISHVEVHHEPAENAHDHTCSDEYHQERNTLPDSVSSNTTNQASLKTVLHKGKYIQIPVPPKKPVGLSKICQS